MVEPLRWWVIPGALIVLARVVTLGDAASPARSPRPVPAAAPLAEAAAGPVLVRDASGARQGPLSPGFDRALVLTLPGACAGQRVAVTVWRRTAQGRDAEPWIRAEPRVRGDGVLPIAGQPAGRYDVEVRCGERRYAQDDVALPGAVDFTTAR